MKILLIEDEELKRIKINNELVRMCEGLHYEVTTCDNLTDSRRKILTELFDLVIFDMYIPLTSSSNESQDVSNDILEEYKNSINYNSEAIAITKYQIDDIENIKEFNEAGVTVVTFDDDNSRWKESLNSKVRKISNKINYEFLIFCALSKERAAFRETNCQIGSLKRIKGLDCLELSIGDRRGLCIVPQRMGLVNMAITTSKAIEYFQPKLVAMSGICAGVKGESDFLDVLIGDVCWEYQTGKYKDGKFSQEPYQAVLDSDLLIHLRQIASSDEINEKIKKGLYYSELSTSSIKLGPISSGSAVIADAHKMKEIGLQSRKLIGLEMEMYALYEAAHQSLSKPLFFGAKCVVDLGDASKGDHYHNAACTISARFVEHFINIKMNHL